MHDLHRTTPEHTSDVANGEPRTAKLSLLRYRAFISYSHSDAAWASWLHRKLESYRIPSRLRGSSGAFGPLPDRLSPIFRDREDLASAAELGPKIQQALADSEALIVICSPEAVRSHWVNQEIVEFKRLGGSGRIYSLIVAGEPNASDERECFPPALRFELGDDGGTGSQPTELIAADVRPGKDGKSLAKLKLLSGLLGVDLDRLRQRETQRRNRRMLAITALALTIMLATSLLAVQAVIERRAAERRQKQAENLVGFMLGELNDKLAEVQRLDIMESVDNEAMRYFESLPTTDVTDEALRQRAKALEKIGGVRLDQGHLSAAMESYQAALKLAAALAHARPTDTARQLDYAEISAFIGTTHWHQGELDAAQRAFESAQAILLRAQMHAASDQQLIFQLETIDNNFGHVLEARGRLDEATSQYRKMLALCQQLVLLDPGKTSWAVHLGLAHNNLGKLALMRGDLIGAVAGYAADDAIETDLAARNPKNNNQQEKVAITRATLGRTLALTGDIDTGITYLQQAVEIANRLLVIDPANASFQEDVGLYGSQLARLLRLAGRLPEAVTQATQSTARLAALTRQDPANVGWQREFAQAQLERAMQLHASGQVAAARVQANAARTVLDPLLANEPDDRATVLAVVAANLLLAALSEDAAIAQSLREAALKLTQSRSGDIGDPRLLELRVDALLALGRKPQAQSIIRQLQTIGYRDAALIALLGREGIEYPVDAAFQERLQAAMHKGNPS